MLTIRGSFPSVKGDFELRSWLWIYSLFLQKREERQRGQKKRELHGKREESTNEDKCHGFL